MSSRLSRVRSAEAAAGADAETLRRRETVSFEAFLDEFAAAFVRVSAPHIDREIKHWLKRLVEFFDADRSSLAEFAPDGTFIVTHAWGRPGTGSPIGVREQDLPWLVAKLRRGELFAISSPEEFPAEAVNERLFAQRLQIKAHVAIPLLLSGQPIGVLGIVCMRRSRQWPPAVLQRLRLVGMVLGNVIARKRAMHDYMRLSRTLEHAGRVATTEQLASSFVHEIKQPLGASLTNAQSALKLLDVPSPNLAEVRAALEDIVDDNRRAGDIVQGLRRFLRRQEPSFTAIPIPELFDAVVHFVTPEARKQGIEINVVADERLPDVLADRVQVQQVFVNLLLNSFDALDVNTPGERRVLIAAAAAPLDRVAISVRDSGPGVPEHLRGSLFEPFVTTKRQGLGIGLAIAQTIVTEHGSRLTYSDARNGGAVFTFSLPAAPREVHAT